MAYATIDDITKRYPPITTMIGASSYEVASDDVTSIYINDAAAYIDAYLGARYQVPLQAVQLITQLNADLAIFEMLSEKSPSIPDMMQARWTRANSILGMLRDGSMILTGSQTLVTTGDTEAWSSTGSYHPVFSPVLRDIDQQADPQQVEADLNERNEGTLCNS